jgi:hypothetical protein
VLPRVGAPDQGPARAAYLLNGSFLQAGIGNTQEIKIGKAAAHELAEQLSVCRQALETS